MTRLFRAIESKQFIKNNFSVEIGKTYDLETLQNNVGNNSIIKYFREELSPEEENLSRMRISKTLQDAEMVQEIKEVVSNPEPIFPIEPHDSMEYTMLRLTNPVVVITIIKREYKGRTFYGKTKIDYSKHFKML